MVKMAGRFETADRSLLSHQANSGCGHKWPRPFSEWAHSLVRPGTVATRRVEQPTILLIVLGSMYRIVQNSRGVLFASACFNPLLVAAQTPIDTVDFEDSGFFDLSEVRNYCGFDHITSTSNTAAPRSFPAAVVPWDDYSYCPGGLLDADFGLMIPMNGVIPGATYEVGFWWRMTEPNFMFLAMRYGYPATGQLPPDPVDLGSFGPALGEAFQPPVAWREHNVQFTVPVGLPWPSDVYLQVGYMPDTIAQGQLELDDFILSYDFTTGVTANEEPLLFGMSGNAEWILLADAVAPIRTVEIIDITGRSIMHDAFHRTATPIGISGLRAGVYILRSTTPDGAARSARFVKE